MFTFSRLLQPVVVKPADPGEPTRQGIVLGDVRTPRGQCILVVQERPSGRTFTIPADSPDITELSRSEAITAGILDAEGYPTGV